MNDDTPASGPILRIFSVQAKPGCGAVLLKNFAGTSADVVRHEPGNLGYFFGKTVPDSDDQVMFVSVWQDLEAVKTRFGESWQASFLPEGYEDLIDSCSLRHVNVGHGWHVDSSI